MSVLVNGQPIAGLVHQVLSLDGHLAPNIPTQSVVTIARAPSISGVEIGVTPREITIGLDVRAQTFTDRQRLLDIIKRRLAGLVELASADLPGRIIRAELRDLAVEWYSGAYANPVVFVRLQFVALDPARWETQPLVYGLSGSRTVCPVGTDTSAPDLEIYGSCTDPVIILRNHLGAEVSRCTFTATLGSTDALVISTATQTITRYNSGVAQSGALNGLRAWASGSFPILAPEDASPLGTAWPSLELSATSGTPTGLVTYFRRW